jgi:predicted nucleic acid-binding protein
LSVAYVDTSALVKLLVEEPESAAVRAALGATRPVTSVLATVELSAAVRRRRVEGGEALAAEIAVRLTLLPLSDSILETARGDGRLPALRALDLLHLLTARAARQALAATTFIAYDAELLDAAGAEGFATLSPGATGSSARASG